MYLKRLDLQGFKSFPDKVKLEFNKGITAVVGPNGSGKSNISDSVRWVLGEQRVKSLRGDKMEDVIFAGTADRRPLGFAEVSITLDNEDKKMPLDYSEITVTRTVYRSGESKYAINKTPCRLKDIHELFMDTGVGREGYSIIGQGRIDEILSSKSEDRRRLFEEAAGIVKYRARRSEAIAKLEREQQNLLRVEDIISELETKVEPLRIQKETAVKYLDLKETLKKYEVNDFCINIRKIDQQSSKIAEAINIAKANIDDEQLQYDKLRLKSEELREQDSSLSEKIQLLNTEKNRLTAEKERNDGEIKLAKEQILNLEAELKRLNEEIHLKKEKYSEADAEANDYIKKAEEISNKIALIEKEISEKEAEYNEISGVLDNKEALAENYKSEIIEKIRFTTEINTNINSANISLKQLQEKKTSAIDEKTALEGKAFIIEKTIESRKTRLLSLESEKEKLDNDIKYLEDRKNKFIAEADEISASIKKASLSLNEKVSRIKVLTDMKNEFEGYYSSVKKILSLREKGTLKGICGAVAELIETEKKYETAIEIALGGALQNIVVETEEDGKRAIEYLKKNNGGRATFMPVSVIKGKDIGSDKAFILKQKGVCGIADELVTFNPKFYDVVKSLLGRVVIVDNMDNALLFVNATGHKYKAVTLSGDVLNVGGTMTGGSFTKKTGGIFGRNREITDLIDEEKALRTELESLNEKQDELDENILDCSDEIRETVIIKEKSDVEINALKREIDQNEEVLNETKESILFSEEEFENAKKDIEILNSNLKEYKESLEKTEKEIENINSLMAEFQSTLQSGKEDREKLLSYITDKKIEMASAKETNSSNYSHIKRLENDKKSILREIEENNKNTEEKTGLKNSKENELSLKLNLVDENSIKLQNTEKELEEISTQKSSFMKEFEDCINEQQSVFETISKLKNDLYKQESKIEKFEEDRNSIFNRIWEEYEITLSQAKKLYDNTLDVSDIPKKIRQLKNDIKDLGSVNVNAIEEYKEVKERFEFLTSQRNDIKEAENNLMKVIDDLAEMMKKQFKEQFGIISQNFNEVFRQMFGGGQGYLKLSDERDILDSGIDIIAQPPGKKLQNMMLLSGGERALTAIAILFAILKMKPSPFCILDEIEAALDDANVKRFADYLKSFSGETQFIVITHRKGTMEAADVMYGVTMQERGISKVISVNFNDAVKDAK